MPARDYLPRSFPLITLNVAGCDSCIIYYTIMNTFLSGTVFTACLPDSVPPHNVLFILFLSSCVKGTASPDEGVQPTLLNSLFVC